MTRPVLLIAAALVAAAVVFAARRPRELPRPTSPPAASAPVPSLPAAREHATPAPPAAALIVSLREAADAGDWDRAGTIASEALRCSAADLLEISRSGDPRSRAYALILLGHMRVASAVPALVGLLAADAEAPVRMLSAKALGRIGTPEAFDALRVAARADADPRVRLFVAAALGFEGNPRVEEDLSQLASRDVDAGVVAMALRGLPSEAVVRIGTDPSVPMPSREAAGRHLARQGDLASLEALCARAADEAFRVALLVEVRHARPEGARPWLERVASTDASAAVRSEATRTLGSYP